jgi:Tfp pilus assembly protein PilE
MGQQQLLLIVLGVIIVGIAVVVGINLFNASAISSNRDAVISDLSNLAALAHEYYAKPSSMAGGGNSFVNFAIPAGLSSNGNGSYSITTAGTATTIVFQGVGSQVVSGSNKVTVNYKVFVPPLVDSAQVVY